MSSAIDTAFELATRVATKAAQPKPAVSLPAAPAPATIAPKATDYGAVGGALGYGLTAGQKITEQATAKQNQVKTTDFSNLAPNEVNFVKQAMAAGFGEDQIKEGIVKLREPVQKKSSFQEFASLPTRFIQGVADVGNGIQKGISKGIDYLFGTNSYGQDVKAGKKSDQMTDQLLGPKAPVEDLAREGGRIAGSMIMTPGGGEFATAGKPLLQKAAIKAGQVATEFAGGSIGGLAYEGSKEGPIDWNNVLIGGAISAAFPVVGSVLRGGANLVKAGAEKLGGGPRRLANKLASSGLMNPSAFNRAKDELAMGGIGDEADDVSQFLLQRVRPGNKKEIADQLLNISANSQEAKKGVLGLSQTAHNPKGAEPLLGALHEELAGSMSDTYNKVASKVLGYANKIKQGVGLTLNELDDIRGMARKYLNPYTASGKVKVAKEDIKEVISSLKSYIEDAAEKEGLGKLAGYEGADNLVKTLNNQTMVSRTMAEGILRRDSTDAVQQLVTFMSARGAGTVLGGISGYQSGPIPDSVPFHTVGNVLIGAFVGALVDNTKVKTTLASWLNKIPKEQKSEIYERMVKKGKPKLSSAAKKEIMQFAQKAQMLLGEKKPTFSKTAGKELQGAMKMEKAPEVDKSVEKFFELDSSPEFKPIAPTQVLSKPDLQAGLYETKYGTIQNVIYDRGLPKYNVGGKTYDIGELGGIFKKQATQPVNKEAQAAISTLKDYYAQGGRRAKYIKDFLDETGLAKTVDEIPEDQAENVLELVRKRKRDDAAVARVDNMKSSINGGEVLEQNPVAVLKDKQADLVALHNLSLEKLQKLSDLGGLPMPSIAVTKAGTNFDNFGEITMVAGKETVDPKIIKSNKLYPTDAYTPRVPEYTLITKKGADTSKKIKQLAKETGYKEWDIEEYARAQGRDREHYAEKFPLLKDKQDELNSLVEKKLFKGFTYSGSRKYENYDINTVFKEMKAKGKGNESSLFQGSISQMAAKKSKSITLSDARDIDFVNRDQAEELYKEVSERYDNILSKLYDKADGNGFLVAGNLSDAYSPNIDKWYNELKSYGMNIDKSDLVEIDAAINDFLKLPKEYIEAKPERIVELSEFNHILVPEDKVDEVKSILGSSKMRDRVVGYKEGESRSAKLQELQDKYGNVFFSMGGLLLPAALLQSVGNDANMKN